MKRQTHKKISLLGLGLYVLILLHSATVLSQPTQSLSEQKERIDKLKSIVRQDPLATQAIDELHKLQKQQQAEKIEALDACLEGLTSFMQGRFEEGQRRWDYPGVPFIRQRRDLECAHNTLRTNEGGRAAWFLSPLLCDRA